MDKLIRMENEEIFRKVLFLRASYAGIEFAATLHNIINN